MAIRREIKDYIDYAIRQSIAEYKRCGLLRDRDDVTYADACDIIASYYKGGKGEASMTYAIQGQRFDPYYRIIPLYFEDNKTIENIAEELGVDVSTVVRNKKRLCLAIYNEII